MRKIAARVLLLMFTFMSVAGFAADDKKKDEKKPPAPMKIKVGDAAPDFTLLAFDGQQVTPVSLKDYRGKKNVALAFYVFAFTGG